jgi:ribosomal-protein-alanine N-acetyltransferase
MLKISIIPAGEENIPEILEIMKTANMHYVPSPEMPELDWKCFFVARVEGKIIGAAGYKILSSTEAKTTLMTVHPDFRKHGIGRLLQERRMLAMCDQGIKTLITNADIPETIAWYKKYFGYREIGKLRKIHEFGRSDVDEWTTLQTDLVEWRGNYDEQRKQD